MTFMEQTIQHILQMDETGHGTHVAGIIGAREEKGRGIVGVASYAEGRIKLMALKGTGSKNTTFAGLCKCLDYAIKNGATISSNSWSAPLIPDYKTERAWKNVLQNNPNHLFITSAGNDDWLINNLYRPFTCGIQEPNLLCVASSNRQNQKRYYSNYGRDYVHVFAPGSCILSTLPNNSYGSDSGTSMAVPHVSGLAALVRTLRNDLNGQEVRNLIESNVVKKSAYSTLVSTGGIIDAEKTLKAARISGMNL